MKKFIINYMWSLWLGAAVPAFTNIGITNWRWWAICFPVMFFVVTKEKFGKSDL